MAADRDLAMVNAEDQWIVSVLVAAETGDAAADRLRLERAAEPVVLQDAETGASRVETYWEMEAAARAEAEAARALFPEADISVRRLPGRDWQTFWRYHFHAHRVGRRLFICPEWEADLPMEPGGCRIIVQPGLSFGTGTHFTTRFCLEALETIADRGTPGALLDVGTGSGILAVAGVRLGFEPVVAVDNDPVCLDQARANARRNSVEDRIEVRAGDALRLKRRTVCDTLCANLYRDALLEAASRFRAAARRHLVLSGIREEESATVAAAYAREGWTEVAHDGDGEWVGWWFSRNREAA